MYSEEVVTYLAALYAELKVYEAKRNKAAALLADDDTDYRQKVVAGWDHAIGVVKAKIEKEEAKA